MAFKVYIVLLCILYTCSGFPSSFQQVDTELSPNIRKARSHLRYYDSPECSCEDSEDSEDYSYDDCCDECCNDHQNTDNIVKENDDPIKLLTAAIVKLQEQIQNQNNQSSPPPATTTTTTTTTTQSPTTNAPPQSISTTPANTGSFTTISPTTAAP